MKIEAFQIIGILLFSTLLGSQSSLAKDEIIGTKGNHYLIISQKNADSPTNVSWSEKSNGVFQTLKTLTSGEKCNGGASKIKEWQYALNMTPVDILSYGSGSPLQMDEYRDLDSGATSCIGQAIFQFDPNTQMAKLVHVKLSKRELPIEAWVLELNYQYCFNRLYNSYLYRGQLILDQTDLDRFKNQFEAICMASKR